MKTTYGTPLPFSLRNDNLPVPLLAHFLAAGSSCFRVACSEKSISMASAPSICTSAGGSSSASSSSSSAVAGVPRAGATGAPTGAPNENAGALAAAQAKAGGGLAPVVLAPKENGADVGWAVPLDGGAAVRV